MIMSQLVECGRIRAYRSSDEAITRSIRSIPFAKNCRDTNSTASPRSFAEPRFLNIALTSAAETRQLLKTIIRLYPGLKHNADPLQLEYAEIGLMLQALMNRLL